MAINPDDFLTPRPDPTSGTVFVVPLSSTGSDGKATNFVVRDEKGNTLLDVDSTDSTVVHAAPSVRVLTETHAASTFTDGGGTSGTATFTGTIPVGAILLGSKVVPTAGFAGDTTAVLTIGDGSDVDRCNTSTANVFATAADGVQSGIPSGSLLVVTAFAPVLTVTSASDAGLFIAGGGSVTVSVFYVATI